MVIKAYKDSDREPPTPKLKADYRDWIVTPTDYINICWDNPKNPYKVFDLDKLYNHDIYF